MSNREEVILEGVVRQAAAETNVRINPYSTRSGG